MTSTGPYNRKGHINGVLFMLKEIENPLHLIEGKYLQYNFKTTATNNTKLVKEGETIVIERTISTNAKAVKGKNIKNINEKYFLNTKVYRSKKYNAYARKGH